MPVAHRPSSGSVIATAPIIAGFAGVCRRVITNPVKEEQMDLNNITITGRLTQAADLRSTRDGTSVCSLRVAYTQRSERHPAGFIDVEVWGSYGETCAELQKGARVGISGELRFSEWETSEGNKRQSFSVRAEKVAFLSPNPGSEVEAPQEAVAA